MRTLSRARFCTAWRHAVAQVLAHGVRLRLAPRALDCSRESQRGDVVEVCAAACAALLLRVVMQRRRFRCRHVNLVEKSNVKGEVEFLFAPFSVFTFVSVHVPVKPTASNPIVIVLEASIDNRDEPDDLPISPWN